MGFLPQTADPNAVLSNLRVRLANNIHASERFMDVSLDTASDLTHHSAVLGNSNWLSAVQLQQSLLVPWSNLNTWTAFADHGARVRSNIFKYFDECIVCQHRAFDRLFLEA